MVDAATAEQFLDANPEFAKQYYDANFRPKVISDLLDSNRRTAVDISEFRNLTTVEESEILFDLVRDIQDNLQMEKSVFKLMRHLCFMLRADRMSLFMYRQRNGVAELSTRLVGFCLWQSYLLSTPCLPKDTWLCAVWGALVNQIFGGKKQRKSLKTFFSIYFSNLKLNSHYIWKVTQIDAVSFSFIFMWKV